MKTYFLDKSFEGGDTILSQDVEDSKLSDG